MTNEQLIANAAVMAGIMTPDEIQEYVEQGKEIPLHTYAGWARRNRKVRLGERGLETRLWKRKSGKSKDADEQDIDSTDGERKQEFCLVKSYLFQECQTIPAEQEEA